MNALDPVPIPEWAIVIAKHHLCPDGERVSSQEIGALARLIVSVWDGAIREAAETCHRIGDVRSNDMQRSSPEWLEANRNQARGAYACYRGVSSLLKRRDLSPKEPS